MAQAKQPAVFQNLAKLLRKQAEALEATKESNIYVQLNALRTLDSQLSVIRNIATFHIARFRDIIHAPGRGNVCIGPSAGQAPRENVLLP